MSWLFGLVLGFLLFFFIIILYEIYKAFYKHMDNELDFVRSHHLRDAPGMRLILRRLPRKAYDGMKLL